MSRKATSEQLYNHYHDAVRSNNDKLQTSYLLLLKNRASYGSSEAKGFLSKIEGGK